MNTAYGISDLNCFGCPLSFRQRATIMLHNPHADVAVYLHSKNIWSTSFDNHPSRFVLLGIPWFLCDLKTFTKSCQSGLSSLVTPHGPDNTFRSDHWTVTNPNLTLSGPSDDISGKIIGSVVSVSATPLVPQVSQGSTHSHSAPTSHQGLPHSLLENWSTTHSIPATPPGLSSNGSHLLKTPGTPHTFWNSDDEWSYRYSQHPSTSRQLHQCRWLAGVPVSSSYRFLR